MRTVGGQGRAAERGRQAVSEPHVPARSSHTGPFGMLGNWGTGKLRFCPGDQFSSFSEFPGVLDARRGRDGARRRCATSCLWMICTTVTRCAKSIPNKGIESNLKCEARYRIRDQS